MNQINFVKLCESIIKEVNIKTSIDEALQPIIALGTEAQSLKSKYSQLISKEKDSARKQALDTKRKIELHKVRSKLAGFVTRNNIVSQETRTSNPNWLDAYIKDYFSVYPGLGLLSSEIITDAIPEEPSEELLPPPETLPLALEKKNMLDTITTAYQLTQL